MRILKFTLTSGKVLKTYGWCDNMLVMDTKRVKELTGLTDDQISYLIKKVDVLKREKAQGKAREYSFGEFNLFKTIANLRANGVSIRDINKLLNVVTENPDKAATVAVYATKNKKPLVKLELNATDNDLVAAIENHFFNEPGPRPDLLILANSEWIDEHPMYENTVRLTNEDQPELELITEEEAQLEA